MNFYFHIFIDGHPPKLKCNEKDPEERYYYLDSISHYGKWKNLVWKLDKYNFVMSF